MIVYLLESKHLLFMLAKASPPSYRDVRQAVRERRGGKEGERERDGVTDTV